MDIGGRTHKHSTNLHRRARIVQIESDQPAHDVPPRNTPNTRGPRDIDLPVAEISTITNMFGIDARLSRCHAFIQALCCLEAAGPVA